MTGEALRATVTAPTFPVAVRARGLRPITAVHAAILLMIIGNLGRLPVFTQGGREAPILVNELALGAVLMLGAVACMQARSFRVDAIAAAALAFAATAAVSALLGAMKFGLSATQLAVALAYLARWVAYLGFYLVLVNAAVPADAEPLWRTYERTTLAFAAFGLVQAIFLPGFAQLVFPSESSTVVWDVQGHRLVSTLLDPNFAGAFVLLPLLVILARLSYGERVALWKPALLLAAVLATASRSTVLALLAGLAVLLAARGLNRRMARLAAAATLVLVPFVPMLVRFAASFDKLRVDESAMLRFVSWSRAFTVLLDNPWLGVGFNTYPFVQGAYGFEAATKESGTALDGGLLFVAVMTGVIGLLLYTGMLGLAVRRCRRVWRDVRLAPDARGLALGVGAGTVAMLVHSVFVNSLLLPFILEALWLLWALVFLHARAARTARGWT